MQDPIQEYLDGIYIAEQSKLAYAKHLSRFSRWLDDSGGSLSSLTLADTQGYITWLSRKHAPSTCLQASSAIRSYCAFTGQEQAVQRLRVPVQTTSASAPKALSRSEELECLRRLQRHVHSRQPLYIAVFTLMLHTGIRAGELCSIHMDHIRIWKERNGLRGELRVCGKGGKYREVPVPHAACQAVTDWLQARPQVDSSSLFLTTHKRPLNVRAVERICAISGCHPHILRHTYASRLVRSGVDLVIAAELLGHSSVATTQRYAKPSKQDLLDAVERAF